MKAICKICYHYELCKEDERCLPEYLNCNFFKNKLDVVEVKQGEWIKISLGDFDFVKRYKCSLCENIVLPDTDIITYYRYCYNCGARMKWKGGAVNG